MALCGRPQDRKSAQRLGGKGVNLLCANSGPRDPGATFLRDYREPEGSESANPKFPNFGKFRSRATDDCIINVGEARCGRVLISRLNEVMAECKRKQKRADDRHSP